MNEGYRAWGVLTSVMSIRELWIKAKKCIHEGVIVPTALYRAEAWGMRNTERRKENVLKIKCLRSLVGVSPLDRVRNEEVHRRAGIERELTSRADQRVLRWFGHVERMDEYRNIQKDVDSRSQWRTGTMETEFRLDGWHEGGLRQQRNDGRGCTTMRERVENSGTYVTTLLKIEDGSR